MARKLPLYDTLDARAEKNTVRFHMPGHKGKCVWEAPLAEACRIDFTELYGTGNLYDGVYPIADAERLAAKAWRTPQAFFLTGGASMGNFIMLSLARQRTKKILIDRGAHKSVYNAVGINDLQPVYLYPRYIQPFGVSAPFEAEDIVKALDADGEIGAVIITSPTYYGVCSDIEKISKVCHDRGVLLLVDEAHGAHFPFLDGKKCAVEAGADLAVASMHKTLPALGQAALLTANHTFKDYEIRKNSALFGTSSPSYQIMASMDITRDFMEHEGREICLNHAKALARIRAAIETRGVFRTLMCENYDALRLCVMTSCAGISGYEAARYLEQEHNIVCEMADERQVLFIITAADTKDELSLLEAAIEKLEECKTAAVRTVDAPKVRARAKLLPGDALKRRTERIKLGRAVGRVAACNICPYPPGIPVIAVGEVIEENFLEYLYHNGFSDEDYVTVIEKD